MVAPDRLGKHSLVNNVIGTLHKVEQYIELLLQQSHRISVNGYLATLQVEHNISRAHCPVHSTRTTTHHTLYTRRQFGHIKGLWQIVIGTKIKPLNLVIERIACRYYYHPVVLIQRLYLLEQTQTIAVGQHYIQQNAVIAVACNLVACVKIGGCNLHHIAFTRKRPMHDLTQ